MGPYIIGFDTLGFYVPNTLLWLHNGINIGSLLAVAPLFYSIYISIVGVGSAVFALKIISPLLLGFLGLSIFAYATKGLCWSPSKSTFVALLGTVYFVALRASWDQLREELGLIFFFLVLMLLLNNRKEVSWKNYVILSLTMMAVVLSHQLVSVLMFGVIIVTAAYSLLHKDFVRSINLVATSLPALFYFLFFYLSGAVKTSILGYSNNVSPLSNWTGFASYQSMLLTAGGFFLYCFLPLIPLAIVGLWRFRNLQLKTWLLFSLILIFIPLSSANPFRWILLLMYPIAFSSTDALSKLKLIKWKRFKFTVHRIGILYLVLSTAILSFGFIFMTPENPFFYFDSKNFNNYVYQIPTSMLQNTISINDCHDTVNALHWFKDNLNSSAILLTHTAFYGWALLTLNINQVRNYGFDDPAKAALAVTQETHNQAYLIWWVKGQGWYNVPTLPSSFHEVYSSGKIAIYSYIP